MKRSNGFPAVVLAAAVLAASAILSACGGGGGGGGAQQQPAPKVQLSGSVGTGYTPVAKSSNTFFARLTNYLGFANTAYAVATPVNKVIAIPVYSGSLNGWNMTNSVSSTIDTSNNFSLSLTKDSDWLLLLLNTNLTGTQRFVGSVAMNTGGTGTSMLSFPATVSPLTALNLGTIDTSGSLTDAITSKVVGTADFSLTAAQLSTMAQTDKYFRNAMNIVNNYEMYSNGTGKYYQLRPDFSWSGSVVSLTTSTALNSFPTFTYTGMSFQLDQNVHAGITVPNPLNDPFMTSVCTVTGFVSLHPPVSAGTVTIGGTGYTYDNPIKNSGAGCSQINGNTSLMTGYGSIYATNSYEYVSFSISASLMNTTMPSGFWEWKENNVIKTAFDLANINPPINASGQLKAFVPVYQLVLGAGNKITRVNVAWYYYNGSGYTKLPDADRGLLKHFVNGVEAKFDVTYPAVGGTRRTCEMYIDPSTETFFDPNDTRFASTCQADAAHKDWYFNNNAISPQTNIEIGAFSSSFIGFYESGGFGYFFGYR